MTNNKNYTIIISDNARSMLSNHIRSIAQKNVTSAKKTKSDIITAIKSLSKMPERFPYLSDKYIPYKKYRKMFVKKWYLIIYQIIDNIVFVDYIMDCRQDYSWLL